MVNGATACSRPWAVRKRCGASASCARASSFPTGCAPVLECVQLSSSQEAKLSIAEVNRRIDYTRRYALALVSPLLVLTCGVTFYYFAIRVPPDEDSGVFLGIDLVGIADGVYFATITMTVLRPNDASRVGHARA